MPKKKKPTKRQLNLLEYMPNKDTWICTQCQTPNTGLSKDCSWCRLAKPKKPNLLWPEYIEACNIVGLDPDKQIRYRIHSKFLYPIIFDKKKGKWVKFEPEEVEGT